MYRILPSSASSPHSQVLQDDSRAGIHDKLTRRQFIALWTVLILLHALCSAFLLCSAKLYWLMENEYLDYFAGLLGPERDRHFHIVGTALGALGAVHGLQLLSHLGASIIARQLKARPLDVGSSIESCWKLVISKRTRARFWSENRWKTWRTGGRKAAFVSSRCRYKEGSSEYDTRMFVLRKSVEIATQIPNGYLYSTLVARPWINHAKVSLVVANCWSAFIIHQMLLKSVSGHKQVASATKSRTSVRFSAILVDSMLATATAVVLPSAIFLPYALQFDFENLTFPGTTLYGDTTFPNLVLENRAFFFMSWANAAMKIVPHFSVFLCLRAIGSMLHSPPDKVTTTKSPLPEPATARPSRKRSIIASASSRALRSVQSSAQIVYRIHRVTIPMLLLVSGGIVLGLHLSAQYGSVAGDVAVLEGMCLQRMHPWLASNFSCAVVTYNCYKQGVTTPSTEVLTWLERAAVRKIIFMHCSVFTMPPIIREFPSLMGVELWNTTLVEWGEDAAVSATLHPVMLFALFVYVNLTAVPPGILQAPLPEQLTDLEFIYTNLTTIPEDVVEPWSGIKIVYIEHSQLNPFPSSLMRLPVLSELSLIDNKVETIPDDAFLNGASSYFYNLALSKNPLRELPQAPSENFDVSYLALEFTQLTNVPAWVNTNVWDAVSLGGSPVCETNASSKLAENVLCGGDDAAWDPLGDERYPTSLIKPFRSLDA